MSRLAPGPGNGTGLKGPERCGVAMSGAADGGGAMLGAITGGAEAGAEAVCPEGAGVIPAAWSSPTSNACTAVLATSWSVALNLI